MEIKRFIGGILEANCYVISSREQECYIIDPGYNPGRIIKYIEEKGEGKCLRKLWRGIGSLSIRLRCMWRNSFGSGICSCRRKKSYNY